MYIKHKSAYLNLVFIVFHALVSVTSSARNVGITNIKVVSNAKVPFWVVMALSVIQVIISMLVNTTPCPIQVCQEKGRIIEDHLGSGRGLEIIFM